MDGKICSNLDHTSTDTLNSVSVKIMGCKFSKD
jgi:hypothetical protein